MLNERDRKIIWHPFTQEKTAPTLIPIQKGQGSYLYGEHEEAYLDLISSWWVNIHGHAQPEIAKAIYAQATKLEHVIFAGFTHEPAVALCEGLQTILPKELSKFFFSDNGSTAVEVALKMAYQYWRNLGYKEKKIFLSFEGGYHGDTFGAMSVGAKSGFHDPFQALFFEVLSLAYPQTWEGDDHCEEKEKQALIQLEGYLTQYKDKIAAFILEPLIQGASGMRMCRPAFLKKLLLRLKEAGILVIFDEIMTGFCRTGTYFALDQLEYVPDFLCLSKAITGGFLPLALTVTKQKIYDAFLGDSFQTAFAHGHSYTANPLSCAAGIASLQLLKESNCQQAIATLKEAHQKGLRRLKEECPFVEKIRKCGTIAAFNLPRSIEKMRLLTQKFLKEGLLLRPLGQTFYLLPPYCVSEEQIFHAYKKIIEVLKSEQNSF